MLASGVGGCGTVSGNGGTVSGNGGSVVGDDSGGSGLSESGLTS